MSDLRLMLLAAGIVLIIGIYLYTRRAQKRSTARNTPRREPRFGTFVSDSDAVPPLAEPVTDQQVPVEDLQEPIADLHADLQEPVADLQQPKQQQEIPVYQQADLPLPEELRPEPHDLGVTDSHADKTEDAKREKVVVIYISAKGTSRLAGPAIVDALASESLELGEFDIFHRRSGQQSLFSVASMIEPGTFDLATIEQLSTPGLCMILRLPGPDSPVAAFTEMLSTARRLGTALDADVLDEKGSTLSRQAASHMREQIIEFAHRIR